MGMLQIVDRPVRATAHRQDHEIEITLEFPSDEIGRQSSPIVFTLDLEQAVELARSLNSLLWRPER